MKKHTAATSATPSSPLLSDRLHSAADLIQRLGAAAVVALCVATPMFPSESVAASGTHATLVIFWMILLFGWSLTMALGQQRTVVFTWTDATVILFLGLHTLSAVIMAPHGNVRATWNVMWQWLAFGVTYWLLRQWLRGGEQRRALTAIMIGLAVTIAMFGFYQRVYSLPQTRAEYATNPESHLIKLGIPTAKDSPQRIAFENRLRSTEPTSTFSLTNSLAGFLVPWLMILLGITCVSALRRVASKMELFSLFVAAALIAGCLLLTKSRSGYVAVASGLVLLAWFIARARLRMNWKLPLAIVATVMLIAGLGIWLGDLDLQVLTEARKSLGYRIEYWQASLEMIRDRPWLGCGSGNFQTYYAGYKLPQSSELVADPHNFLVEIWATAGTPALVVWLAMLLVWCWKICRGELANADESPGSLPENSESKTTGREKPTREKKPASSTQPIVLMYGGAILGLMLGYTAALFAEFTVESAFFLCVPVGVLNIWGLHRWTTHGVFPNWIVLVGVAALAVNLLAAGGISFPGVAQTLWIGLALAIPTEKTLPQRTMPVPLAWLSVIATFLMMTLCFITSYAPVLNSRAHLSRGELNAMMGQLDGAVEQLELAERADPWSPEPSRRLAEACHHAWLTSGRRAFQEEFESAGDRALARDRQSHSLRRMLGDLYFQAYRVRGMTLHLERAIELYEETVRIYPNSNINHAQLAWAYSAANRSSDAARAAEEALRLDALNPHSEQQLKNQHLLDDSRPDAQLPEPRASENTAEQLMIRLRSSKNISKEEP